MSTERYIDLIPENAASHDQLTDWYDAGLNLMMVGSHGVGKTFRITNLFDAKCPGKWGFLNGSTTDPWTDLIGIPTAETKADGSKVIKYIKPEELSSDIEAIYVDELNRAPKAVRNALFELIQFKSINGRKFPNLKVVWASINPPGDIDDIHYDVEELDPAMVDRFHIIIKLPTEPSVSYFETKYQSVGRNLVEWWKQQPEKVKKAVTPRRLEYLAMLYNKGISFDYALPTAANVQMLNRMIESSPVINQYLELKQKQAEAVGAAQKDCLEKLDTFVNDENNFEELKSFMIKKRLWSILKQLKSEEKIDLIFADNKESILDFWYQTSDINTRFFRVINRHMQEDAKFAARVKELSESYTSSVESDYIKHVDSEEKAREIILSYLESSSLTSVQRRKTLDNLMRNQPNPFTVSYAAELLKYLNKYVDSCNCKSLTDSYMQLGSEGAKLLVLCKVYVRFAKEHKLSYLDEAFMRCWNGASIKLN